jgi:hypothetical protein
MTAPIRVLIVDDDDDLRQNLIRRYQRLGMTVAMRPMPKSSCRDRRSGHGTQHCSI